MKNFFLIVAVMLVMGPCVSAARSRGKKVMDVSIQKAVRTAILKKIKDPEFPFCKKCKIEGKRASFDYLQSTVRKTDEYYYSCAEFNAMNNLYGLNFFVQKNEEQFEVVKVIIHTKNGRRIDEVVWEKPPAVSSQKPEKPEQPENPEKSVKADAVVPESVEKKS